LSDAARRVRDVARLADSPIAKAPAKERLTAVEARRIALAAQGFAQRRPTGRIGARQVRSAIEQVGLLQLDSVNVFSRSHYLPLFARLGPYPREVLDRLAAHTAGPIRREFFEYWGHEASLIPVRLQPHLRWRMARAGTDAWGRMVRIAQDFPDLVERVYELVAERGPIRAAQTGIERRAREPGAMWNWHDGKVALEYLFWSGRVTAARRVNFERLYDLTERVIPAAVLATPTPSIEEAQRQLLLVAARALGVATEPDLGDYFRLPRAESKLRVAELVEAGDLIPIAVDGWRAPGYLWPAARRPRSVQAQALLSPFDSLIWYRERTLRLFGFRYRIEIYTPAAARVHGYYVLPFLLDEALVARVDLKSDRQAGVLLVQGAFAEPAVEPEAVAGPLAVQLRRTAEWLELDDVVVGERGDLAAALRRAVRAVSRRRE
jgi:uncharacterized protein